MSHSSNQSVIGQNQNSQKLGSIWFGLSGILSLVGFGLSAYSLVHHLQVRSLGSTDAACNINATVNCDAVAMSPYAEPFFGIPLGVFGMGFFAALLVMLGIGFKSNRTSLDHLQAFSVFSLIGILVSIVLASLSWFGLGLVCLVCIGVYIVCLALGIVAWVAKKQIFYEVKLPKIINGAWSGAIAVMAVVIGFQTYKSQFSNTSANSNQKSKEIPSLSKEKQEIPISTSAYSGLGEDYRKGPDDAPVVIHEFADFQCPACQQASKTLGDLSKEFGSKILVVFRNYPLDGACNSGISSKMHPFACQAATLARCAGQHGKFWQAHDLIFDKQLDISDESLAAWAVAPLGLTPDQWSTCKNSVDILNKIKEDIALGNKFGVDSTPTIFINGKKILGRRDYETLRMLIDQELRSR